MSTTRPPRPRSSQVTKASKAGDGSKNIWIIAAVVAVIAFAGIIAVALAQESGDDGPTETAEVTVTGDRLVPVVASTDLPLSNGSPAPELAGTSIDGDPMTIADDGRPKVIGFFAHWCNFCQAEVPEVSAWVNDGNLPDDVDFVAVSTSVTRTRGNYPPSRWFEGVDWAVPTMKDDAGNSGHIAFGGGGFPYWVVVDADGLVVERASGQIGTDRLAQLFDSARTGYQG